MTSSNGNIFRVTGPFRGETTGHRNGIRYQNILKIAAIFVPLLWYISVGSQSAKVSDKLQLGAGVSLSCSLSLYVYLYANL